MLLAPMLGMPLPLLPLQILWMNLVTDGLPALSLSLEPAERNVMSRLPRHPSKGILSGGMTGQIARIGLVMGSLALATGYGYWRNGSPQWQTVTFTTLTLSQMAAVLALRSERDSLFRQSICSNLPLLIAVLLTCSLQIALISVPFLQQVFKTIPLSLTDLALCLLLSTVPFWAIELEKGIVRWRKRRQRSKQ